MSEEAVHAARFSLVLTERRCFYLITALTFFHLIVIFLQAAALLFVCINLGLSIRGEYTYFVVITAFLCTVLTILGMWNCRSVLKIVKRKGLSQLARKREDLFQILCSVVLPLLYVSMGHKIAVDLILLTIEPTKCIRDFSSAQWIFIGFIFSHVAFIVVVNVLKHFLFNRGIAFSTRNSIPRTRAMSSAYTYPQGDSRYLMPSSKSSGTIRTVPFPPAPSLPTPTFPEDHQYLEPSLDRLV